MTRDNVFMEVCEPAFEVEEHWFPLRSENTNSAPGDDIPSLAGRRGVQVATTCFTIRRGRARPALNIETPIAADRFEPSGRALLAGRAKDWFLSDPA